MKLLLLSNSTLPGEEYFQWPKEFVKSFLGRENLKLVFIPFAGVTTSYDEYFNSVKGVFQSMGYNIISIHQAENKTQAILDSDVVITGGGNTFHLLSKLYEFDLIAAIRKKIQNGGKYIGWSAGSNITCPSIKTTNDMPIVEPPSFEALNLIPFQINPHFTDGTIPNHGGETRSDRIREFITVNQHIKVIGLPEGCLLEIDGDKIKMMGDRKAKIFEYGKEMVEITKDDDLSFLMEL